MSKLYKLLQKGFEILKDRLENQGVKVTVLWVFARGIPKLTGVPILRFSRVLPNLYVGPQYNLSGKRKLEGKGIHADVNLRIEFDDREHGLALAEYLHLPTVDDQAPAIGDLEKGIDFIQKVIDNGGKVYIHCAGGVGRAPTMAAAYLMSTGMSLEDSLALIRKARPFIRVMPVQLAQLQLLQEKWHQKQPGQLT